MAGPGIDLTPLAPGQRVAIFPIDDASGATLGYYGTVIAHVSLTVRAAPTNPEQWLYWVYVPALDRIQAYPAWYMVAVGGRGEELESPLGIVVRFEGTPGDDNQELRGAYRLPGNQWGGFLFRKRKQPLPTFQLRAPVLGRVRLGADILVFDVPASERLDGCFVLTALAKTLCAPPAPDSDNGCESA